MISLYIVINKYNKFPVWVDFSNIFLEWIVDHLCMPLLLFFFSIARPRVCFFRWNMLALVWAPKACFRSTKCLTIFFLPAFDFLDSDAWFLGNRWVCTLSWGSRLYNYRPNWRLRNSTSSNSSRKVSKWKCIFSFSPQWHVSSRYSNQIMIIEIKFQFFIEIWRYPIAFDTHHCPFNNLMVCLWHKFPALTKCFLFFLIKISMRLFQKIKISMRSWARTSLRIKNLIENLIKNQEPHQEPHQKSRSWARPHWISHWDFNFGTISLRFWWEKQFFS